MQFESYFFNKAESSGEYCYATAFLLVLLLLYLFRGLLNPILSFCKEQCKYLWFAMLSEESFSFSIYLSLAEHHSSPSILSLLDRPQCMVLPVLEKEREAASLGARHCGRCRVEKNIRHRIMSKHRCQITLSLPRRSWALMTEVRSSRQQKKNGGSKRKEGPTCTNCFDAERCGSKKFLASSRQTSFEHRVRCG